MVFTSGRSRAPGGSREIILGPPSINNTNNTDNTNNANNATTTTTTATSTTSTTSTTSATSATTTRSFSGLRVWGCPFDCRSIHYWPFPATYI